MVFLQNERGKENFFKKYFIKSIDINKLSITQKYLIFTLFCIYITTCVGIFFNWISLSDFFYSGNVYINYCNEQNKNIKNESTQKYSCEEQDKKVQSLYPIILCSNFIMSAISGIFFDYCGPKITALIGHSFNILSWILIGLQGEGNNSIIFGGIFLGLSCDSTFIPILNLIYLFPKHHTVYTVILGCCASLSFSIPIFLELFSKDNDSNSFQLICFLYCIIILVPFFFVLLIFLPWKHIQTPTEENIKTRNTTIQELESYVLSYHMGDVKSNNSKTDTTENQNNSLGRENHQEKEKIKDFVRNSNTLDMIKLKNENSKKNEDNQLLEYEEKKNYLGKENLFQEIEKEKKLHSLSEDKDFNEQINLSVSQSIILRRKDKIESSKINENFSEDDVEKRKSTPKNEEDNIEKKKKHKYSILSNYWQEIKLIFFSLKYISICYYFTIFNLSLVNYNECAKLFFKDYNDIQNLLKIFGPLSVFPCALLGFLIRKIHILPIIFCLLMSNIFMYTFAVLKLKIFAYFSSFCYLIVTGCYTTQLYCYIQLMFPKCHFGKIAGTTSMISGLLSLLNIPIYNYYIVDYNNNDPNPFAYIVIVLLISTFPLLFYIYKENRKEMLNL
ncbi:transporter, putative [Plasmodium relictum]|uniref:Transporter, putative n=1 Tax=Plasmodium relictum TaxID=85471 RepID=A0A1J1HGF9_PLARL|nr:transporter, putative [Plasmodium relictum]CRH03098.1 transporter, putative [Plasmodium relictum]